MPQLVPFASNTIDRSNSAGFQWEFYCFRCGNGYLSTFRAPTHMAAEAGGALAHRAGDLIPGGWGGLGALAGHLAGNVASDAMNDGARSAALKQAIAEVAPMFAQCPRCGRWRCRQHCWNANAGLCLDCAPYMAAWAPPAQPWGGVAPAAPSAPIAPSGGYNAPAGPYNAPYGAPAQPSIGRVASPQPDYAAPAQPYQQPYPAAPMPQAYQAAPVYAPAPQVVAPAAMIAPVAVAYAAPLPQRAKLTGPNPLLVGLIGGVVLFVLIAALYYISASETVDPNLGGWIVVIVAIVSFLTIGFAAAALRGSVGGATLAGLISGAIGSLGFAVGELLASQSQGGGSILVVGLIIGLILLLPFAVGAGAGLGALGGLIGRLLYKG